MANRHRGEIEAVLNGQSMRLCLTLGALAELEAAFGEEDLVALATRFERGRISAHDCLRIIAAGLRGAGNDVTDEAVAAMQVDGGAAGFVAIVAALLKVTFGVAEELGPPAEEQSAWGGVTAAEPRPFPGMR
jgi:hypothetical protein